MSFKPVILRLPEKISLQEYGGDPDAYMEAVYEVFAMDFVDVRPYFRGTRLGLKSKPLIDGKEYTFYHFTHKGKIENERVPDMRRMERMPYPAPMINQSECPSLKVWRNKRNNKERILIYHEEERYLVVLADRGDYILPWTAYYVEYSNKNRRLLKEYEDYKKAKTAQG